MDLGDRVLGPALRAEPVGARLEVRLEDRLQHQLQGRLHDPVRDGRDPQPAQLAAPAWGSSVPAPAAGGTGRPSARPAARPRNASAPDRLDDRRRSTPSTPAVRAPLLPRTRSHATTRNAGSSTRLNRSSNRRSGSSLAHRCSLVWISSTRARPHTRSGHGAPVFTSDLLPFQLARCELAGPLRHVAGFPGLGLLRGLRPTPTASADDGPARRPAWLAGRGGDRRDGSHVHC